MFTHMGNWEWLARVQELVAPDVLVAKVYRKLKNDKMDAVAMQLRQHWGGVYVDKKRVLREVVRYRTEKQKILWGLNSDQKPRPEVTRTWVTFLHQETGFVDGAEVLATKFDYPVFFSHVTRIQRGYYRSELSQIAADPKALQEGDITRAYAQALRHSARSTSDCRSAPPGAAFSPDPPDSSLRSSARP